MVEEIDVDDGEVDGEGDGEGDANERGAMAAMIMPTLRAHKNEVLLLADKDDVLPSVYA